VIALHSLHSLLTHDHGTPRPIITLVHAVIGKPDLDPASHPKWNELIQAKRIITEEQDAHVSPWFADAPLPNRLGTDRRCLPDDQQGETVFNNPPNDRRGRVVAFFWRTLVEYFFRGYCRSAIFVGFNVEQLSRLQRVGARTSPLRHPTIVPRERPEYLDNATLLPQSDPAHASFITLLSRDPREIQTFIALGQELGDVTNGH
jgi:hypothetical protein